MKPSYRPMAAGHQPSPRTLSASCETADTGVVTLTDLWSSPSWDLSRFDGTASLSHCAGDVPECC